jgi:Helix-turn-helix domain
MPIIIDGEEYLSIDEACAHLGGISRETLRRRTKASGIKKYTRGITRNVYYRRSDLDRLNELRPMDDENQET